MYNEILVHSSYLDSLDDKLVNIGRPCELITFEDLKGFKLGNPQYNQSFKTQDSRPFEIDILFSGRNKLTSEFINYISGKNHISLFQ